MKTVKEWLTEWEHPAAEKALKNAEIEGWLYYKRKSLSDALFYSFRWPQSNEGREYWMEVWKSINAQEIENNIKSDTFIEQPVETIQTPISLSRRDYFAAMAMQGLITLQSECLPAEIAHDAVKSADALIAELNKQTNEQL